MIDILMLLLYIKVTARKRQIADEYIIYLLQDQSESSLMLGFISPLHIIIMNITSTL